jgi:hypothetical protein
MKLRTFKGRQILLGVLLLSASLIAGCSSQSVDERVASTITAYVGSIPTSTNTAIPQPSATLPPTPIPPTPTEAVVMPAADTETPAPAATDTPEPSCLRLLEPENGVSLRSIGRLNFVWEPLSGAAKYLLVITPPDYHFKQIFESEQPGLNRWLDTIPWAGEYSWQVSALDADGQEICVSRASTFNKTPFIPTATLGGGARPQQIITPTTIE